MEKKKVHLILRVVTVGIIVGVSFAFIQSDKNTIVTDS